MGELGVAQSADMRRVVGPATRNEGHRFAILRIGRLPTGIAVGSVALLLAVATAATANDFIITFQPSITFTVFVLGVSLAIFAAYTTATAMIEALLINRFLALGYRRCFGYAMAANVFSVVLGFVWMAVFGESGWKTALHRGQLDVLGYLLLRSFVLTLIEEGLVIMILVRSRASLAAVVMAVLSANAVSYVMSASTWWLWHQSGVGRAPVSNAPLVGAGTWVRAGERSTTRAGFAVAGVGDKLYLAGGLAAASTLEVYDPARDEWRRLARMPTGRFGCAAAAVADKLYVVGGVSMGGPGDSSALEVYDPRADEWTSLPDMPTARSHLGAAVVAGRLYAVGGVGYEHGSVVEVYDPGSGRWTKAASMIAPRTSPGVGVADGRLYALGGNRFGGPMWEVYNPTTGRWRDLPEPPFPVVEVGAAGIGHDLYVLSHPGGPPTAARPRKATSLCHVYDTKTGEWARISDMPSIVGLDGLALQGPTNNGVAVVDGRLCVVGGTGTPPHPLTPESSMAGVVTTVDMLAPVNVADLAP